MAMERKWDWCVWILGKGGILVGCKEWVGDLWRREPRWDFCCNTSSWEVVPLKWPRGDIYRRPRNDQNALWKTKGRSAAVAIFAVGQPRQINRGRLLVFLSPRCRGWQTAADAPRHPWGVSVATLPLLLDRGTSCAAAWKISVATPPLVHQPRHFWFQASRLSIFAHLAPNSPDRAKIPLPSEKPTKTSKETLNPRFYPRNIHKRIRKGGYI